MMIVLVPLPALLVPFAVFSNNMCSFSDQKNNNKKVIDDGSFQTSFVFNVCRES